MLGAGVVNRTSLMAVMAKIDTIEVLKIKGSSHIKDSNGIGRVCKRTVSAIKRNSGMCNTRGSNPGFGYYLRGCIRTGAEMASASAGMAQAGVSCNLLRYDGSGFGIYPGPYDEGRG